MYSVLYILRKYCRFFYKKKQCNNMLYFFHMLANKINQITFKHSKNLQYKSNANFNQLLLSKMLGEDNSNGTTFSN